MSETIDKSNIVETYPLADVLYKHIVATDEAIQKETDDARLDILHNRLSNYLKIALIARYK